VGRGYESEQVLPLGPVNAFRNGVVPDLLEDLEPGGEPSSGDNFPELAAASVSPPPARITSLVRA